MTLSSEPPTRAAELVVGLAPDGVGDGVVDVLLHDVQADLRSPRP